MIQDAGGFVKRWMGAILGAFTSIRRIIAVRTGKTEKAAKYREIFGFAVFLP